MTTENVLNDAHIEFLNEVRDEGDINMFAAAPLIEDEFGVTRKEAKAIVSAWMATFRA